MRTLNFQPQQLRTGGGHNLQLRYSSTYPFYAPSRWAQQAAPPSTLESENRDVEKRDPVAPVATNAVVQDRAGSLLSSALSFACANPTTSKLCRSAVCTSWRVTDPRAAMAVWRRTAQLMLVVFAVWVDAAAGDSARWAAVLRGRSPPHFVVVVSLARGASTMVVRVCPFTCRPRFHVVE